MLSRLRRRNSSDSDVTISGRDAGSQRTKSRRPPNTAFRQQRLKAWQPILAPRTVLPLLCLIFLICGPIGAGFMYTTYGVEVVEVNYSKCESIASSDSFTDIPSKYYSNHFKKSISTKPSWKLKTDDDTTTCQVRFQIPNDISPPLFLYYKLTDFYQNHRKYVSSYDWNQLKGEAVEYDDLDSDCKPLRYRDDKVVYPCGLVANSLFNDTFSSLQSVDGDDTYEMSQKGIAWNSDIHKYKKTHYNASSIVPPENWAKKYPDGYTDDNIPDLSQDELFMNWMRTAALPNFMKLAGKNTSSTLQSGTYQVDIELNYPVTIFGGTKSFVISTSSVLGGRHISLAVCYLIVAGISLFFLIAFFLKQVLSKRKIDTHRYLLTEERREAL
ncbi:unnamed protein product [Kuraishia capsulata CBS 1993]|uniref:Cell division control protein 50 n=1 Tax=Kuraishia capsulata CBS 1993 TaxID=1382522 RepID=W6MPZ4_9ASCO|nr:uncharacterized protein KUCA_T00004720001 [Kuraishia capsulata CBS 1993]CDK28736.1 unnamed protein product [Kuraishia capsulata CBS 1993]